MIKQFMLLHWLDKRNGEEPWRVFKKSFARWKREGVSGMRGRLDKEYEALKEDIVLFHNWSKRYESLSVRFLFTLLFVTVAGYYLIVKSELYESQAAVLVKDLNEKSLSASGLGLLGVGVSSQVQDSKVLQEYLASPDMLRSVEEHFSLFAYFQSDALDWMSRLSRDATQEDFLEMYRNHLNVVYDEASGILHVAFSHTDPVIAQEIVMFLIERSEQQLNIYNERNAQKQLRFVKEQVEKNRGVLNDSIARLEAYQNEHLILDPTVDAQTRSGIIATLEASLVEKQGQYNQLRRYMSDQSFEIIKLKNEIGELKRAIEAGKKELTGSDQERLNAVVFEYETLKNKVVFDTEVFKESLVQLEVAKVDANKQAKVLVTLTTPNLPDGYTYPDKPRVLMTLIIVFTLLYGIVRMLTAIIKEHKD